MLSLRKDLQKKGDLSSFLDFYLIIYSTTTAFFYVFCFVLGFRDIFIIKKFNKSKSEISQVLSFLTKKRYIDRVYVNNLKNHGSRHKILLNESGLKVAEAILLEGLNPLEIKALEVSIKKKRRLKF